MELNVKYLIKNSGRSGFSIEFIIETQSFFEVALEFVFFKLLKKITIVLR